MQYTYDQQGRVTGQTYDAWGNILTTTGSLASTLGTYNPLRYRGYVYDTETGFYYLQSRYYDPQIGRFINADILLSTGQGVLGNNMFAYCNNNPVNGCDPCGTCIHRWDFWNDCEKCGGKTIKEKWDNAVAWCVDAYDTISSTKQQESMLGMQVTAKQNEMIADAAETIWNACQSTYALEQESIRRQAEMNVDMFDSPEDVERSADIIDATLGFSVAAYELALITTSVSPPAGAVAWALVGLAWAGRAVYRSCQ